MMLADAHGINANHVLAGEPSGYFSVSRPWQKQNLSGFPHIES
jgi:hypothetical protein